MTQHDLYMWFRMITWMAALGFMIGNFVAWSTRNMNNDYYYARSKNGWWCIFWLIIFAILNNWTL